MVRLGNRSYALNSEALGPMVQSNELLLGDGRGAAMRERLDRDGYLLFRSILPAAAVAAGRARIESEMAANGWFADGTQPSERVARPGGPREGFGTNPTAAMLRAHECRALTNNYSEVMRVLEAPEVRAVFAKLFGEPAATLDYKWMRAVSPSRQAAGVHHYSSFHVDNVYMGRGSDRLTTCWIPWHDIEPADGGLCVLSGSSSLSGFETLRSTYGEHDVSDSDIEAAAGGSFGHDPAELLQLDSGARWLTTSFREGDVLLFGMKTVHGPLSSERVKPPRVRLSTDTRWQPASEPVDDRHTVGLGPDDSLWVKHGKFGLDWARDSKALNKHKGPWRSMAEAKRAWGLPPPPPLSISKL